MTTGQTTEGAALYFLRRPSTCSELGALLWLRGQKAIHGRPQSYARPAGKLINRLLAEGKVRIAPQTEGGVPRYVRTNP